MRHQLVDYVTQAIRGKHISKLEILFTEFSFQILPGLKLYFANCYLAFSSLETLSDWFDEIFLFISSSQVERSLINSKKLTCHATHSEHMYTRLVRYSKDLKTRQVQHLNGRFSLDHFKIEKSHKKNIVYIKTVKLSGLKCPVRFSNGCSHSVTQHWCVR
jgi:hypothetical protein